jgi:hypothetical protein
MLLAFELVFLAAAFWYVFVREEKPYEIVGDPWGLYPDASKRLNGQVCGEISPKGKVYINRAVFKKQAQTGGVACVSGNETYVAHHGFVKPQSIQLDASASETALETSNVTLITEGKRIKSRKRVA